MLIPLWHAKLKVWQIVYKCQKSVVSVFAAFVYLCILNRAEDLESVL